MGRPPISRTSKTKATAVRLTEDVKRRIEKVAGEHRMAAFIREAIEEKLAREADHPPARSPTKGEGA